MYEFVKTTIPGLTLIHPKYVGDDRGYMIKPFERQIFLDNGIDFSCYEAMESKSQKGVLRGLHLQRNHPQAKLVRVVFGEVFDVAVDLRVGSPTFGSWQGFYISAQNRAVLYLPRGFAHGFLTLSEEVVFSYQCDAPYLPEDEQGLLWSDPDIAVEWPLDRVEQVVLSEKDKASLGLAAQYGKLR